MTPSDEAAREQAVERGARALWNENIRGTELAGFPSEQLEKVTLDDLRRLARAVLDAAFPSGEQPGGENALKIARMERDWLLGAWAAATGVSQVDAEAEFLKWSSKWRDVALAESSPSGEYQRAVSDVVEALRTAPGNEYGAMNVREALRAAADFVEQRFAPTSEGKE